MEQVVNLRLPTPPTIHPSSASSRLDPPVIRLCSSSTILHRPNECRGWTSLLRGLKCDGRFSFFFSDDRKQEQARKALESALGGKKNEFEKWDKEIKRREEAGGGSGGNRGGWFRWGGGWFGGSDGDHFWREAEQTGLTILGIIIMFLLIAKGELILAIIFNPLLYALRRTRNGLTSLSSQIFRKVSPGSRANFDDISKGEVYAPVSAKENVIRKWRND